jgi:hypothetical protein
MGTGLRWKVTAVTLVGAMAAACGGGGGGASTNNSPSTPTTPTQTNRAPVINSMAMAPAFGIAQLSTFSFSANASDPDGDSLTYTWSVGGNSFSTASGTIQFSSGGTSVATVTVTDGKGGSVSDSRSFVVGSMAGTWSGTLAGLPITMTLTQPGAGLISGTWVQAAGSGILDPATINKIDASGNVTMRLKVSQGRFNDFTITGTIDQTGARFVGVANGSGFSGSAVVLTK